MDSGGYVTLDLVKSSMVNGCLVALFVVSCVILIDVCHVACSSVLTRIRKSHLRS
jgi:hypothetical protein